jgi:2-haloacid dehalogenase
MTIRQKVKALAFDAYGTLFDVDSLVPACEKYFPGRGRELCSTWRSKQIEYFQLLALIGKYEDFWQITGKALGFACKSLDLKCEPQIQEQLHDRFFSLDLFPDVRPALQALSEYTLVILSNGTPKMLQVAAENAGIAQFFSQIISSSEVQSYKPHPQVYQWAAQRLGLELENIGLVSSNSWDVTGAKSSGLFACWVNRNQFPWEDLGLSPDVEVQRMTELPGMLSK